MKVAVVAGRRGRLRLEEATYLALLVLQGHTVEFVDPAEKKMGGIAAQRVILDEIGPLP